MHRILLIIVEGVSPINKLYQKVIAVILCVCVAFPGLCVTAVAFGEPEGYVSGITGLTNWSIDENGCLTVSGTGPTEYTMSGSGAFRFTDALWVKRNNEITSAVIEPGITKLSDMAFYNASNLASVSLPDTLEEIGGMAFYHCTALTEITIPKNVADIHVLAFSGCTALEKINVDPQNEYFSSENGVLYNKQKTELLCCPAGYPKSDFVIPDGVKALGSNAFANREYGYIHIPASVETIHNNAFSGSSVYSLCSDIEDCAAKTFAESNSLRFYVCSDGNHAPLPDYGVLQINGGAEYALLCGGLPDTAQLTLTKDGEEVDPADYKWRISNSGSGNVDAKGVITAYYCGEAVVTVSGERCIPDTITIRVQHTYDDEIKAPTCTEGGYTTHTCTRCRNTFTDSFTEPLGHDYEEGFCERCREESPEHILYVAQTAACRELETKKADCVSTDALAIIEKAVSDINSAQNTSEVERILTQAKNSADAAEKTLADAKTSAAAELEALMNTVESDEAKAAIESAAAAVNQAADITAVYEAVALAKEESGRADISLEEKKKQAAAALETAEKEAASDEAKDILRRAITEVGKATSSGEAESIAMKAKNDALAADGTLRELKEGAAAELGQKKEACVSDEAKAILDKALSDIASATNTSAVTVDRVRALADADTADKTLEEARIRTILELETLKSEAESTEARAAVDEAVAKIQKATSVSQTEQIKSQTQVQVEEADKALSDAREQAIAGLLAIKSMLVSEEAKAAIDDAINAVNGASSVASVEMIASRAESEIIASETCDVLGHKYENGVCTVCGHVEFWEYSVADGKASITGYTGTDTAVIVPDKLEGVPVTAVSAAAFAKNSEIEYVRLPDSVRTIEKYAFLDCEALREVYIGRGAVSAAAGAFSGCSSLAIVCITSQNFTVADSTFQSNDERLTVVTPQNSATNKNLTKAGLNCISYEFPVMRGEEKAIAFYGKVVLYQDLDYYYWTELSALCSGAVYMHFDSLELEGIATSLAEGTFDENHLDPNAEYVTFKDVFMSLVIDGETVTFDRLTQMLEDGYTEIILTFDDGAGGKLTILQRITQGIMKVFRTITRIVNAVIRVFKKK